MRTSGKNPTTLGMQQLVRVAVAIATVTARKAAIHDGMKDAAHALPQLNLDACALNHNVGTSRGPGCMTCRCPGRKHHLDAPWLDTLVSSKSKVPQNCSLFSSCSLPSPSVPWLLTAYVWPKPPTSPSASSPPVQGLKSARRHRINYQTFGSIQCKTSHVSFAPLA